MLACARTSKSAAVFVTHISTRSLRSSVPCPFKTNLPIEQQELHKQLSRQEAEGPSIC